VVSQKESRNGVFRMRGLPFGIEQMVFEEGQLLEKKKEKLIGGFQERGNTPRNDNNEESLLSTTRGEENQKGKKEKVGGEQMVGGKKGRWGLRMSSCLGERANCGQSRCAEFDFINREKGRRSKIKKNGTGKKRKGTRKGSFRAMTPLEMSSSVRKQKKKPNELGTVIGGKRGQKIIKITKKEKG